MATYAQQMQAIFARFEEEVTHDPTDLRAVYQYAIKNNLWKPRPSDIFSRFREHMARALREEYRTDAKGRRYRAKHAVLKTVGGKQLSFWVDIDNAPRPHMVKALAQRRKQVVGDCYQLRQDVDHYNDANPVGEPIQLVLDFTEDVEERYIESGIRGADAA